MSECKDCDDYGVVPFFIDDTTRLYRSCPTCEGVKIPLETTTPLAEDE